MRLHWKCAKSGAGVAYLFEQILEDVHAGDDETIDNALSSNHPTRETDEVAENPEARTTSLIDDQKHLRALQ